MAKLYGFWSAAALLPLCRPADTKRRQGRRTPEAYNPLVPNILYLHGFASSPGSQKVQSLHELLVPQGIELIAPDLNVPSFEKLDYDAMVETALRAGSKQVKAVVGSSLGCLIALEVVRRGIAAPLVLIAPAIGIADRWLAQLPPGDPILVYNYAIEAKVPIHRAFFERMARVDVDRQPPPVPVTIFMGRRDESIPFDRVSAVWRSWQASGRLPQGSRFEAVADGDHRLTDSVGIIAEEVRRMVASDILPSLG